jgi:hypothetical protein
LLAVHNTGAYGASMASQYNLRPVPAEVVLERAGAGGYTVRLVRPRKAVEALVEEMLAGT